ncbi:MAG TPA: hypothetical protein VJT14_15265 [Candidatus Dormibacteraeota bacterium]|nr:hypothetical protein [Candidatus Dormibacteraeota bacterium]
MVTDLTRRGIYALPAAGLLTAVPWIFILRQPSIKTDPEGYARSLTASGTTLGGYLYLTGLICLLFGMLALYSYLAQTRGSSWAAGGMMISVIAISLALPVIGILGLANTVLADVYLAGHKDVSAAMRLLEGGTLSDRIKTYIGILIYISLTGAIAYIVAVWKSGSLPRVAGVLVAAGFVLSITLQPFVGWVGALCLVIGGVWVARYISQTPPRARIAESNSNLADAVPTGRDA